MLVFTLSSLSALTSFYTDTNGKISWINTENWLTSSDYCDWYGVKCDEFKKVIGLNLRGNGLTGRIPESLHELKTLRFLDLSNNTFETKLKAVCGVQNLEIFSIQDSNVNFELPDCFCDLKKLKSIDVTGNQIVGAIPACLRVKNLFVECNNITGEVSDKLNDLKEVRYGCNDNLVFNENEFQGVLTKSCQCKSGNNCQLVYNGVCGNYVHEDILDDYLDDLHQQQ